MSSFDDYCIDLLEDSKHFLEIAKAKYKETRDIKLVLPYLRSALLISFSSLEAFIFVITNDFSDSKALNDFEKSFLSEKEFIFENGSFVIKDRLKMTRLIERIEFLFIKFKSKKFNKSDQWWSQLNNGIQSRNSLVHPKDNIVLTIENVSLIIESIISCIDLLFQTIYKKPFPTSKMGLVSRKEF